MKHAIAIVLGALIVAAAILFSGRYELVNLGEDRVLRIDRLTGAVEYCDLDYPEEGCYRMKEE